MLFYIVRRVLQGVLVVLGVAIAIFALVRIAPGDPARLMAPTASPAALDALRHQLGLDQPLPVQFVLFLAKAIHGDFGHSYYYDGTVLSLVLQALPYTLALTGVAVLIALCVAFPLGILAALRQNSLADRFTTVIIVLCQSAPNFWIALLLLFLVAVNTGWFSPTGYTGPESIILPSVALSIGLIAYLVRAIRLTLSSVFQQEFVRALRARGVSEWRILWSHGIKNIAVPILTVLGIQVGYLLGGAVVVEFVFNYPGVGLLILHAVLRRDLPLVEGIVIVTSAIFVTVNLLVDLTYAVIDPRLREQERRA